MRPEYSAASRFAMLKNKVQGEWFKMAKLKKALDKDIAEAGRKAAKLATEGNRFIAEAEYYEGAMKAFKSALKGEPLPEAYKEEYRVQVKASGDNQHDAYSLLIANNHRRWIQNRNDGGRYLQAAGEWETLAKGLLSEFVALEAEILSYA